MVFVLFKIFRKEIVVSWVICEVIFFIVGRWGFVIFKFSII